MLIGSRVQIHFCVNPTKFQVISRLNFLIENSFCPSLGKTFDDRCQDDSIGYSFDCLIMQMSIESPCFFLNFFYCYLIVVVVAAAAGRRMTK